MLEVTAEQTQQLYSSHREVPNLLKTYANTDTLNFLQPCNNLKHYLAGNPRKTCLVSPER